MYQNIYYQREKNLIHLWDDKLGYRSFLIQDTHTKEQLMANVYPFMEID